MPFIIRPEKNRKFNHIPIYWDKKKEEFDERIKKINDDLDRQERGEYVPDFRGKFGRSKSRFSLWHNPKANKSYRKRSFLFVINVVLVIAIIYLIFKLLPFLTG